ncbi:MAG: EAL domain-containing protein [Clostridia bacterium]|nr:EAL domain-containing protein [Clostridia bacterium]
MLDVPLRRKHMANKSTVLVADDHLINRQILGGILSNDYNILYACNGKECLELLKQHANIISAVILDIVMPEMDGYEVLRVIKDDPVLSNIPVIVSSTTSRDESEIKALALGAQDFITKPYNASIICHRLANFIKLRENAALINSIEKDELTGLYNKQFFFKKVTEILDENPYSEYDLICLDIERFKLINDTFGMSVGDDLLKYIASCLIEFGKGISICSHFGADIFFIFLPHLVEYTDSLFHPCIDKFNEFPIQIQIKARYGIYPITDSSLPINAMCDRAQLAVDEIKGQYDVLFSIYDDKIRQRLLNERFITDSMQTALKEEQFKVYYQPKYDLDSEAIVGAEALVRWVHPKLGFMHPGEFIPLFEKNGFILQLDQYVWEKACQYIKNRIEKGLHPISISVNVSRTDMYNPKLPYILKDLVKKYNIPIQYLHLEITETAYTENPEQIFEVVKQLRCVGFIIEMDDFGSGYSSLNMLAEVPIDILKLDMRFIKNEANNTSGRGILSFIISLAKWLNLSVVAEGVETQEQILSLRAMGCSYVQGFYFAKPMTEAAFTEILKTTEFAEMHSTAPLQDFALEKMPEVTDTIPERIMVIVDDIEVNRKILGSVFLTQYCIVETENGLQTWEYLQENYDKVDIILLDLLMPVMDGFELLEKIRQNERMKELPVIITSQVDKEGEARSLAMKANDFISKPYNLDIVQLRVKNVIAAHQIQQLETEKPQISRSYDPSLLLFGPNMSKTQVQTEIKRLRTYFDLVRMVDPEDMRVTPCENESCDIEGCYCVWGKSERCNNCISLRALRGKTRYNKLEYSSQGLFFVISQYVEVDEKSYVIEMVTKLDDTYVSNILDKELLFLKLDELNRQLESDELTGVYNRRHIDLHLASYIENAQNTHCDLEAAMIDIDSLKAINDTYGHLTGDSAIKKIANILNHSFSKSRGDFVARYGGDEFFIVCRNIEPQLFHKRIHDVIQRIHEETIEDHEDILLGISAGCVSLSECSTKDAAALIQKADERLYRAKASGKNTVCTE